MSKKKIIRKKIKTCDCCQGTGQLDDSFSPLTPQEQLAQFDPTKVCRICGGTKRIMKRQQFGPALFEPCPFCANAALLDKWPQAQLKLCNQVGRDGSYRCDKINGHALNHACQKLPDSWKAAWPRSPWDECDPESFTAELCTCGHAQTEHEKQNGGFTNCKCGPPDNRCYCRMFTPSGYIDSSKVVKAEEPAKKSKGKK